MAPPPPPPQDILLFPFMAQGHIIPFLSLALKLEQETNFTITLINTPQNISKLKTTLPIDSAVRLLSIPFSGLLLPPTETTENLPDPLVRHVIESSEAALGPAFRHLISQIRPACIISDMFLAWTAEIARESNALHAIFITSGGYGMSCWTSTCLDHEILLSRFPKAEDLPETTRTSWEHGREILRDWRKTDAMLFNTVEGFDRAGLDYFRENFKNCSVFAVGPIINRTRHVSDSDENGTKNIHPCMEWLDSKAKGSVIYVAFGSQNTPSEGQTLELAEALEASNANFIWAFRAPSGSSNKDRFLPRGFEGRIRASGRGLLVEGWAPQADILAHESVSAFMSHCGWNSTVEGLSNGVPMLTWPMGADQPFNARWLEEEIGAGVGVASGVICEVKHDEIVRKIELIMRDDEGNAMRRKACEVREGMEKASKGSSAEAMESFLNIIMKFHF